MADHFFDTSAISKHYQAETGTAKVDALLSVGGTGQLISRLSVVELHSALAKKVRTGHLSQGDFLLLARRFRGDVATRRLRVVRLLVAHFQSAERLIRRIGLTQNLRTLDAVQLAVALSLNEPGRPITFVCADHALCAIAAAEGLPTVNPEVP
ncbi:MAG TPA: type II toxin-antitoxin system VapC family toxin [Urbifossiella sp.]|jgi:predicted nucleic acid-binding protein|nr:type II toxin-antitoxin system VapC family toxin [Urbifossiella sp.]